ncbi:MULTISPECIES: L,D-transpeptidase [Cyanophyceae]|uniref:L,D-transpeptidase n=1 Tax=Stenomitos frigidus AS-A4 TaxID=2933935 RepID=A0ABV0KKP8_9CYAN|nr:L,D-transpeptidase [Phormidium sp. FACHB-592]
MLLLIHPFSLDERLQHFNLEQCTMYRQAKFSALTKQARQIATIACCTGLLSSWSIAALPLSASSNQIGIHDPMLHAARLNAKVTHLEIHLNRRQAVLYQGNTPIKRYPIGTGREGWKTPLGNFHVMQKKRNPTWINPFTDERITANDPRNPLRGYWIGFWTNGKNWIGFHGTLDASSVGRAASHGCIHMYDSDLRDLFSHVSLGTPVKVLP